MSADLAKPGFVPIINQSTQIITSWENSSWCSTLPMWLLSQEQLCMLHYAMFLSFDLNVIY